jgi:hypothetical protein
MGIFEEKLEHNRDGPASFCGRTLDGSSAGPVPLEDAESLFRRLRQGGVAFVRLVIAWETLEHAGPGLYDESRLAYTRKILLVAEREGISVFIDPVQNRWSRWLSGEGAPPWAVEQRDRGGEWLLERYLDCMRHCARRLKNCGALIGWGASAEDCSRPFLLRFADRMRDAREGTLFFLAERSGGPGGDAPPGRAMGTGDDPAWAAGAFRYYDEAAFPDYRGDLEINTSR